MSQLSIARFPKFIFANNPAELVFRRQGIMSSLSGYAYLIVFIEELPDDGDTMILNIGDTDIETITFTFVDEPETQDELPRQGALTIDDFLALVVKHIYRHPLIRKNFYVKLLTIETDRGAIQIISRRRGKDYNIELNGSSTFTIDGDNKQFEVTTADTPLEDYKLKLRATIIKDPVYHWTEKDIDDLEAVGLPNPDTDEMLIPVYELPELARGELGVDIPENAFRPFPMRKASCLMKIEAEESFTDAEGKSVIQEFRDMDNTDGDAPVEMFVPVLGGLSIDKFPFENFEDWAMGASPKFWTLQPGYEKIISIEQPEWLCVGEYLNENLVVRAKAYYQDGYASPYMSIILFIKKGSQTIFPVGVKQLGIPETHSGSPLIRYEVDTHDLGYEKFTFIIDQRYFKDQRYFIYQNSLGAIDTLRCVGVQKYTVKRTGATSSRVVNSESRMNRGSIEMVYSELDHQWMMRTGWLLNKAEKEMMLDFLRSNYVAEVIMPLLEPETETVGEGEEEETLKTYFKQPYRSVIVLEDSVDMWEDEGAWGFEWKMQYAHKDTNFSNIPALKEQWFDTFIEMTIEVKEITDTEPGFGAVLNTDAVYKIEINGYEADPGYIFPSIGIYHLKLSGSNATDFSLSLSECSGDITITHMETASLKVFGLSGFDLVKGDYWIKRMATLFSLEELTVLTEDDPGFDVDALLSSIARLYRSFTSSPMANIELTCGTPSGAASAIAAYLNAEGVTVTLS